jgi:hypothetical protein
MALSRVQARRDDESQQRYGEEEERHINRETNMRPPHD